MRGRRGEQAGPGPGRAVWCECVRGTTTSCLTHSLSGQHVIDGVVVLLRQDGQLTRLLVFEALQHGLVVRFGRVLQQVVPQGLVLARLDFTSVLELPLDLELFGLRRDKRETVQLS